MTTIAIALIQTVDTVLMSCHVIGGLLKSGESKSWECLSNIKILWFTI